MTTTSGHHRPLTVLTLLSVLTSITLTLLPLLPNAAVPLLTVRSSIGPLYGTPAAVTRPIAEVVRLGPAAHKQEEARSSDDGDRQEATSSYATKVIASGHVTDIPPSTGNGHEKRDAGDISTSVKSAIALLPGSMLDEADHVRNEEYEVLRKAGLSDAEAFGRSEDASMWMNGQRIDSRTIRVGALNVCSQFKYAREVCQTVSEFKGERQDELTGLATFPIDTPAPILLVISLAAQVSLLLTMICALIPWTKSITHLKYRFRSSTGRYRGRAQARQAANTDSICQLVDHRPFDRMKDNRDENRVRFAAYDYAFVALWLASFAFGIAGADVLLALAMEAKNKARAMGQEAALGSGTYLLAVLSFVLLLPLGFFLVPFALQYRTTRNEAANVNDDSPSRFFGVRRLLGNVKRGGIKDDEEDGKSVKSFTCTPYVLSYSSDDQAVRRPDEAVVVAKRETRMVKAEDGEWEMIIPAPYPAHLA